MVCARVATRKSSSPSSTAPVSGTSVPLRSSPNLGLIFFSLCGYSEIMREKFIKAHPLSVVETVDSRLVLRVLTDFRKGDFSARCLLTAPA